MPDRLFIVIWTLPYIVPVLMAQVYDGIASRCFLSQTRIRTDAGLRASIRKRACANRFALLDNEYWAFGVVDKAIRDTSQKEGTKFT